MRNNKYGYYTPLLLSKALLQLIPYNNINSVIDICCGSCNLLRAAAEKFYGVKITGVDIIDCLVDYKLPNSRFYQQDGRDFALNSLVSDIHYDLVLANPPFGYLANEKSRLCNIELGEYSKIINKRYENEMLVANLLLMKENSVILAILPQTFFSGVSCKQYRQILANNFEIECIIDLPDDTFENGKIKTSAIIMKKSDKDFTHLTKLYFAIKEIEEWNINIIGLISSKNILQGNWIFNHSVNAELDVASSIVGFRGSICSSSFSKRKTQNQVLHCSAYTNGFWSPSVRNVKKAFLSPDKMKYAEVGDVLINRIGKNAGCWCVYKGKKMLVSDCIIVLRSNDCTEITKQLNCLSNANGRLNGFVKGLSTQYVSMKELLQNISSYR